MLSNDYIDSLITQDLAGELNDSQRKELLTWLEADTRNRAYYHSFQQTWEEVACIDEPLQVNLDQNWERLQNQMQQSNTPIVSIDRYTIWKRIAAVFLVALGGAVLYSLFKPSETIYLTSGDSIEVFTLPDNSKVYLNRHASLVYEPSFGKSERKVRLTGEAFFDIHPDASLPFEVYAGDSRTHVLGTSFRLKTSEQKEVSIDVVSGKIAFSKVKQNTQDALILSAGSGATLGADGQLAATDRIDPNKLAWKNDKLIFHQVPLWQVAEDLAAYFRMELQIPDTSIQNLPFTGSYDHPKLEEVLEVIELAAQVEIIKNGPKSYVIISK
jgi:transmembrane sensor